MNKKDFFKQLIVMFWLFIFASFIGYIYEMIIVFIQKGHFEIRQGLIYGPFIQVYGIGAIIYYIVLNNVHTKSKIEVFIITAILGGLTEYICSFVQEKLFGTISWDYSYLPFNINGRTSLLHCSYWGIAGILYVQFLYPLLEKLKEKTNNKFTKVFTIICVIFMALDILISCLAVERQTERKNNVQAKNKVQLFLDRHYSDEFLNNIYNNKKDV